MSSKVRSLISFGLTLLGLIFLKDNLIILGLLLSAWLVFLWPIKLPDLLAFVVATVVFTPNNIMAVKNGAFYFSSPDLLGLPYWEFFMWGYYFVFLQRWVGAKPKKSSKLLFNVIMGVAFALCFSIFRDKNFLLISTAVVLALTAFVNPDKVGLKYALTMVAMGTLIEISGLMGGHWGYSDSHFAGLPIWYITMWGGTGYFFYSLGLPLIEKMNKAYSP